MRDKKSSVTTYKSLLQRTVLLNMSIGNYKQQKEGYDYVIYNCIDTCSALVFGLGVVSHHRRIYSPSTCHCRHYRLTASDQRA